MPELIDKAKVLKYLTPRIKTETPYGEGYNKALEDSAALVALMPTIEPEVRHGRWIAHDVIENMKCSECGEEYRMPFDFNANVYPYNFCPNCGAKMNGGADNG